MKPLKIAVCLSGQPRAWKASLPSTKTFFENSGHEIHYFGHAWDRNDWKAESADSKWAPPISEQLDAGQVRTDLSSAYSFDDLVVDTQLYAEPRSTRTRQQFYTTWQGMLRSAALCMNLKTQYELSNQVRFDLVFKTRWDVAYTPGETLQMYVPPNIMPDGVYVHTTNFDVEYRMPLINDLCYYGSSRAMTIIDSFYFYYNNGRFLEMVNYHNLNRAYDLVGPGVLLYKWITLKNLKMCSPPGHRFLNPIPIRKSVENAVLPDDFNKVLRAYAPIPNE